MVFLFLYCYKSVTISEYNIQTILSWIRPWVTECVNEKRTLSHNRASGIEVRTIQSVCWIMYPNNRIQLKHRSVLNRLIDIPRFLVSTPTFTPGNRGASHFKLPTVAYKDSITTPGWRTSMWQGYLMFYHFSNNDRRGRIFIDSWKNGGYEDEWPLKYMKKKRNFSSITWSKAQRKEKHTHTHIWVFSFKKVTIYLLLKPNGLKQ